MDLADATSQFLTQLRADGRSPHTVAQYERHLSRFASWWSSGGPGRSLDEIGDQDVASFLASDTALLRPDGEPKAAGSMNALRSSVRGFFGYLHRSGRLPMDPARVVRMARTGDATPQPFKSSEADRLREVLATATTKAERRDRALFTFMLATGARLSSALALKVGDLDLTAGEARLRVMKGGGALTVYLDAGLIQLLQAELDGRATGPVFCGPAGNRLTARHAQRRFEHWRDRTGLPKRYSPHTLRHTFATRLYERTGDILVVKEALGHRAIGSTMVYARASADRVRAAVLS